MRSRLILLDTLGLHLFPSIVEIEEPVLSEAFKAHDGIEAYSMCIVGRLKHQYLLWDVLMFQAWKGRWL